MSSLTVYVVDTETCGKDAARDAVVEVAGVPVHIEDTEAVGTARVAYDESFSSLTRPAIPISFGAMGTHNITEEMVADAAPLSKVLLVSPLASLDKPPVLCAHNAAFDRGFLDPHLLELQWAADGQTAYWLDTWRCARHVFPGCESYANQALRYELKLAHPALADGGAHRALADALVTALLLQRLLAEKSLRDLCAVQHLPIRMDKFGFGKHRGQPISEVPEDYLRWLWQRSEMGPDEKFSAEMEIRRRRSTEPLHVDSGVIA